MMQTDAHDTMDDPDEKALAMASTQGDSPPLNRLRRAVMSRLFDDEAPTPERLGRYTIERVIGSGGMGAVFAAHDPELDRQVAVKLLHWTGEGVEGKRLLREAKALAKLSHPNVVQVYDAGTAEDRVFLAMELVRGTDLHGWLHARPRGWREVVDVFLAAGRGLAAAHAAGLVHRDFKPRNVLVGEGGDVKVADFGLVRSAEGPASTSPAPTSLASGSRPLDGAIESLTRTGASVGTPAYMAPEQHLALDTDARTDQFSFCVALFEGLTGGLPFRGDSLAELIAATLADRVELPRQPRLPAALQRVIRRGLRTNPADRFPDMGALLEALGRVDRPAWGRWMPSLVAIALLLPLGAGALAARSMLSVPDEDAAAASVVECDAEAKARAIWDDSARARVHAHLVGLDAELGELAATTATEAIDRYLEGWSEAYASTCAAEPASDEARVLAKQLCLHSRLQEARGVISVLEQADAAIMVNVPQIVAALEPVAQCEGELAVVRTASDIDDALSFELARVRSLWHTRRPNEAYAAAEALAKRAAESGEPTIESDAWLLAGMIVRLDIVAADAGARAHQALTAALEAAHAAADPTRALRAEVLLAGMRSGDDDARVRRALERLAARVEASADATATWMYHHDSYYALDDLSEDSAAAARDEHARRMLAIATERFGAGHRLVTLSRHIAQWQGITTELTGEQQRDEAAQVAARFGANSPRAAEVLEELAERLVHDGKLAEARLELERAVVVWTGLHGPKSTQVGGVWRRIAGLEWIRGDYEAALVAYDHAVDALEPNPLVDHAGELDVASSVSFERAELLLELGRAAQAVAAIEETKPRSHLGQGERVGELRADLFGRARLAAGDPAGALSEYAAARSTRPAAVVELDIGEGEALLALGRVEEARTILRDAWTRLEAVKERPLYDQPKHARAGLALARTLAAVDAHDPEIGTLATAALASLASLPPVYMMPSTVKMRSSLLALRE